MPEFRIHDLRHSFASCLVNAGRSLYEVQELLGHADIKTTSRYAHLSRERLIEAVETVHGADPGRRSGQRRLAEEMTRLVHGEAGVERAARASAVLFGGDDLRGFGAQALRDAFGNTPTLTVAAERLADEGLRLVDALAETGLCASKSAARKELQGGAVAVNQVREADLDRALTGADVLEGGFIVLRRGKKSYHLLRVG